MARFTGGWVKLWRKAADSDLIGNPYLWALWHWLLYAATWKPSKILWNGSQKEIPAGTVVFSPRELAERWDCSRSVIQKWLHYLHDTQRIVLTASPRGTLVSICNWDIYQGSEINTPLDSDNCETTASSLRVNGEALSEEGKKVRKKEHTTHPLVELWNSHSGNLPKVKGCSKGRLTKANARWEENSDPTYWTEVITRISKSDFCNGKGNTGWRADFDFLLQPDTHHKALEGKYDNRLTASGTPRVSPELEAFDREMEAYNEMLKARKEGRYVGQPDQSDT
jgi:hypothetical protein